MFKPGERIGHYEIVRSLDQGGMGYVFLARHATLGAEYAIKVLKPEIAESGDNASRFLREGRLASRIRHSNLIAVYDAGCDEATGANYLVMDYVPGGTLADRIQKEGAMPPARALPIIRQVAGALAAAGERGMVHRDIKPANIMFAADGSVKLADLGIAKGGEEVTAMTCSESVFGTPAYMSPEQARDSGKVDARTDIYSLGVVLWNCLAGRLPYSGKSAVEIMAFLLGPEPMPDVAKYVGGIPKPVSRLVRDMCQKNPGKRIASAVELLKRLDDLTFGADETLPTVCFDAGRQATRPTVAVKGPSRTGGRWVLAVSSFALLAVLVLAVVLRRGEEGEPPSSAVRAPTVREVPVPVRSDAAEKAEAERLAAEKAKRDAELEAERVAAAQKAEAERLEAERLAAEKAKREAERLAAEKAEAERLAAEKAKREAERLAAEKKLEAEKAEARRLADEARLAAAAMSGAVAKSEPSTRAVEPKKIAEPPKQDFVKLARAAFAAGNWSLGYQYALQDTTGNPEVLLWLGKCFDPAVEMPGFHRHKKDPDIARRYYRQAAEKGNAEAARALKRL